jgi:hypothetical protein
VRFHRRALDLFDQPNLPLAPDRGARARQAATASGVRLPASVVEWYGVPEASALWRGFAWSDHPAVSFHRGERQPWMEAAERGGDSLIEDEREWGWWWVPRPREDVRGWVREPVLPVLYETQGCCWWGVPLDGSDDPPVTLCRGDQGDLWDDHAGSFSDFVCARLFDWSLGLAEGARREVYLPGAMRGDELRAMKAGFRAEATTRDDIGQFSYRFSRPGQWCSVTVLGPDCRSLGWRLWASDTAAFEALVGELAKVCPVLDGVKPGPGPLYLQDGTAAELALRQQEVPF